MSTETPLKFLVDVNGYASTNMQLFYMLKSYDYIILDICILILYHVVCILTYNTLLCT